MKMSPEVCTQELIACFQAELCRGMRQCLDFRGEAGSLCPGKSALTLLPGKQALPFPLLSPKQLLFICAKTFSPGDGALTAQQEPDAVVLLEFVLFYGSTGEGLCSHCLFLSVVTKVTQTGKAGGLHRHHLQGCWFPLLPTEEGLALAVEAKGRQQEAEYQLKPSDHVFFLTGSTFLKCCLRARTYPGPMPLT